MLFWILYRWVCWLIMAILRMTWGFQPMKLCSRRFANPQKLCSFLFSFCPLIHHLSSLIVVYPPRLHNISSIRVELRLRRCLQEVFWWKRKGSLVNLKKLLGCVRKSNDLVLCFGLCRSRMDSPMERILWCPSCLQWEKSRSVASRTLVPSSLLIILHLLLNIALRQHFLQYSFLLGFYVGWESSSPFFWEIIPDGKWPLSKCDLAVTILK